MCIRDSPAKYLFLSEIDTILQDPEVVTVVESIGGQDPAYYYVRSALMAGKNVVTSNKELVAEKGAELLEIAKQKNVCFLFEASVGGGTPVITPMYQCLCANTIQQIAGIVNGTTNFMLTKMAQEGLGFEEALKIAQDLGYAETIDPSADVDGIDACRKIAILASLAFGVQILPRNIPTRGIREVGAQDIQVLSRCGAVVKLIAHARRDDNGHISCGVEPMVLSGEHQLAGVADVFNAVLVKGDMLGDVMFYGRGAGKLPTASAVVADIVDALRIGPRIHDTLFWLSAPEETAILTDPGKNAYYMRAEGIEAQELRKIIPDAKELSEAPLAFVTGPADEKELEQKIKAVEHAGGVVCAWFKLLNEV